MTPAAFIHARRKARCLSQSMLAGNANIVVERIAAIEAGADPLPEEADAISAALDDDFDVLADLIAGREIRLCVVCGCHEYDACFDAGGAPCGWATDDLCTRCIDPAVILGFDPQARPYVRTAA